MSRATVKHHSKQTRRAIALNATVLPFCVHERSGLDFFGRLGLVKRAVRPWPPRYGRVKTL